MRFTTKNIALLGLLLISFSTPLLAATINVTTLTDEDNNDGDCSLREAIVAANTNTAVDNCTAGQSGVVDQITVNQLGTVNLTSTLIVTEQVEISGMGRLLTRLSGNNQRQILRVNMTDPSHNFTLTDIRIQNGRSNNTSPDIGGGGVQLFQGNDFNFERVNFFGNADFQDGGGAIFAGPLAGDSSRLFIVDCDFQQNFATLSGAALFSLDSTSHPSGLIQVSIRDSNFPGNSATGSGVVALTGIDTVIIQTSSFSNNVSNNGGAVAIGSAFSGEPPPVVILERNSFFGNNARQNGGAVWLGGVSALLTNNTFVSNTSEQNGEALALFLSTTAFMSYNTLSENGDGEPDEGSLFNCFGCGLSTRSNIFWTSQPNDQECLISSDEGYTSLGTNIDGSGSCATESNDLPMTNPLLLPLDDYGDDIPAVQLLTSPPRASSPAIDAAESNNCPGPLGSNLTIDQRGFTRPVNGNGTGGSECDIGAVEYQPGMDPADFSLAVNFSGMGDGQVTSNPAGIDCMVDCSADFLEDTLVSLTPIAAAGSEFTDWSGDCSGSGACQVDMDQARSVTANFEIAGFNLQVVIGGNGQGTVTSSPVGINCPGDCSEVYPQAEMVSLNATPNAGIQFLNWAGDCSGSGACQVNLNAMRRVVAIFADGDTIFIDSYE